MRIFSCLTVKRGHSSRFRFFLFLFLFLNFCFCCSINFLKRSMEYMTLSIGELELEFLENRNVSILSKILWIDWTFSHFKPAMFTCRTKNYYSSLEFRNFYQISVFTRSFLKNSNSCPWKSQLSSNQIKIHAKLTIGRND